MDTHAFLRLMLLLQGALYCTGYKMRTYPIPVTEKTEQMAYEKLLKIENNMKNLIGSLIKQVTPMALRMSSEVELSPECMGSLLKMVTGLRDMKLWALKMFDATGKPGTGIFSGNIMAHGAYYQCLETFIPESGFSAKGKPPKTGKYCEVGVGVPIPPRTGLVETFKPVFKHVNATFNTEVMTEMSRYLFGTYYMSGTFGVCVPSTCTDNDLQQIISLAGNKTNLNLELERCQIPSIITLDTTQIVILIILLIFPMICLVATTILEIKKFQMGKEYNKSNNQRFLLCFSIVDNFHSIMRTKPCEKRSLDCINGMRFISTTWVVLGHTYLVINIGMYGDLKNLEKAFDDIFVAPLTNSFLSVTSFFFITSTLISYVVVKHFDAKHKYNPFILLLRRIWRLQPGVLLTIGIIFLLPLFSSVPEYKELTTNLVLNCKDSVWTNLLFVTNSLPMNLQCAPHTWYVSADIQLFLLGLLYFGLLFKNKRFGVMYLVLLISGSVITSGCIHYVMNYPPTFLFRYADEKYLLRQHHLVFIQFYSHLGTYGVGLFLGTYLARHPDIKISRFVNVSGWVLFTGTALAVVYSIYPWNIQGDISRVEAITYSATHRTVWGCCLGWVILSCYAGKGGYVNSFLSWPGFQPLVKISYFVYLSHLLVLVLHEFTRISPVSAFHSTFVYNFIGTLCITNFLSVVLRLFYEAPLIQMERVFFTWLEDRSKLKMSNGLPKLQKFEIQTISQHTSDKVN